MLHTKRCRKKFCAFALLTTSIDFYLPVCKNICSYKEEIIPNRTFLGFTLALNNQPTYRKFGRISECGWEKIIRLY